MASEQEVKSQVAEMRAALVSIRKSARIGSWVRILGVVVGLIIVALYVMAFINLGKSVVQGGEMRAAVEQRVARIREQLDLERKLPVLAKEVLPVYKDAGLELLKGMNIQELAESEARALLEELRVIVQAELERVTPELQRQLRGEGEKLLAELQQMLDNAVNDRLVKIIAERQMQLEQLVGSEADVDKLVRDFKEAAQDAARHMIARRWTRYHEEMDKIAGLLNQIPPLPESMDQEELIHELTRALLARVKFELPDAQDVLSGREAE